MSFGPPEVYEKTLGCAGAAAGTGLSHDLTLHGLEHHATYHAGQIALLRRAIEARVA